MSEFEKFMALAEEAGVKTIHDLPGLIPALQATEAGPVAQAVEMLAAYVEAIKASGDYERWHYIPEVEAVAEALAALPHPAASKEAR